MNLKKIEFILENTDKISIDGKHIGYISAGPFFSTIDGAGYGKIKAKVCARDFAVEIFNSALDDYRPNLSSNMHEIKVREASAKSDLFAYITKISNITQVILYTENNNTEYIKSFYVSWNDKDRAGGTNRNQMCYISKHDNLYLSISNKNVGNKTAFIQSLNLELINNINYMNTIKTFKSYK